jgi:uncharacterized protein (DUF1330 family)
MDSGSCDIPSPEEPIAHLNPLVSLHTTMKKRLSTLLVATALAFASIGHAAETEPKTVIHVVTVAWKKGTTPEQIQAALDGVKKLPSQYKGLTHVWTRSIKVQGKVDDLPITHAFVMEFASEQAFKEYTDSDAQKEWYKTYLPIRDHSVTSDITN